MTLLFGQGLNLFDYRIVRFSFFPYLGLEEERRIAEEKAQRDEEARLDQLSEDEYEALSEKVKAQIDARRLKARKEKIRQLVANIATVKPV